MESKSYVLVVGEANNHALRTVEVAATMAGADVRHHFSVEAAVEQVARKRPMALAMALDETSVLEKAMNLRSRITVPGLALVGMVHEPTNLLFEEAYGAGVDDICMVDGRALGRRFRQISEAPTQEAMDARRRGQDGRVAVVANADTTTRMLIGRVFLDAGYEVRFARDADHVRAHLDGAKVLIVTSEIETSEEMVLSAQLRRDGFDGPVIVHTPPKQIGPMRSALHGIPNVVVNDAFSPPANLLFVANELCNRPAVEARESERLLFGCTVEFRTAGRSNRDVGFMYNMSAGGVYVRTLAPPPRLEEVWLEFQPPRSDRLVHLEGTAVWTRGFGNNGFATVPSGFGVQLAGGSERDLVRYGRSYQAFLKERSRVLIESNMEGPTVMQKMAAGMTAPPPC